LCGAVSVAPHIRNLGKFGPHPPLEDERRPLPSTGEAKINAACALPTSDSVREIHLAVDSYWTRAAQILLRVALDHRKRFAARSGDAFAALIPLRHRSAVAMRRESHYLEPCAAHHPDQLAHRERTGMRRISQRSNSL